MQWNFRSNDQLLGLLTLPSSIGGGSCDHSEDPVRYMEDRSGECRRSLEGVTDCSREEWLDAASYLSGFREGASLNLDFEFDCSVLFGSPLG